MLALNALDIQLDCAEPRSAEQYGRYCLRMRTSAAISGSVEMISYLSGVGNAIGLVKRRR